MKKTIHKTFFVWDFEKEEAWLNEMAAKGQHLQSVGLCSYTFDEGVPGEYVYRLEMLNQMPSHVDSRRYIRFVEDTGAEHIGSLFRWVYFRKKPESGGFDIFSDLASRIAHLNRILFLIGTITVISIFNSMNTLRLWFESSQMYPLAIPVICLACCLLTGYGFYRIYLKKQKLVKEQALHE